MKHVQSPWPGPRAYEERDAGVFFGRGRETKRLVEQVRSYRLSVLYSSSGAGKSSLINAALVPSLRVLRQRGQNVGATLVLRNWGDAIRLPASSVLTTAVWREIERLSTITIEHGRERLQEDVAALQRVELPRREILDGVGQTSWSDLLAYTQQLCDAVGNLILIVDQAEELLGSGQDTPDPMRERDVLGCIGRLHSSEPRLVILLSLRGEYLDRLKGLSEYVEGIDRRTYRLGTMEAETARGALLAAANSARTIALDDAAANVLTEWAAEVRRGPQGGNEGAVGKAFDLLGLQAVLVESVDWLRGHSHTEPGAPLTLDVDALTRFRHHVEAEWQGRADTAFTGVCLQRYIERLFWSRDSVASGDPEAAFEAGLRRRVLARMAPWLSGPTGFKRHIAEAVLVRNALWGELRRMRVENSQDDVADRLAGFRDDESAERVQGLAFRPSKERTEADYLCGPMRGRSRIDGATRLARVAFALVDDLMNKGLLKGGFSRQTRTCAVAHDGIGAALAAWAEMQNGTFRDVQSSMVAVAGEEFYWTRVGGEALEPLVVSDVSWVTCRFEGTHFQNVVFRDCNLKGSLFSECTFSNCTFRRCHLEGGMFAGGTATGHPSTASSPGLWLEDCWAGSVLFKDLELGWMRATRTDLTFGQILKFTLSGNPCLELVDCDLRNALFSDLDQQGWVHLTPPQDSRRRLGLVAELAALPEVQRPR